MNITLGTPNVDDAVITFGTRDARDNAWITVNLGDGRPSAQVNIIVTDEGMGIDVYPAGDGEVPVASTYAFDGELEPDENEEGLSHPLVTGPPLFIDEIELVKPNDV